MGAWIETVDVKLIGNPALSHPVWVRGLKLPPAYCRWIRISSHPVWVRGLKHHHLADPGIHLGVAPRVGAWIETDITGLLVINLSVAPRVGAWIETATRREREKPRVSRTPCGCVD